MSKLKRQWESLKWGGLPLAYDVPGRKNKQLYFALGLIGLWLLVYLATKLNIIHPL